MNALTLDQLAPRCAWASGRGQAPTVQTCTAPPERNLYVYYQHKIAAQALLADMLGDVPPLIAVHNADELRGERGTWVEVIDHPHKIPACIVRAARDAGLWGIFVHDIWRREKRR